MFSKDGKTKRMTNAFGLFVTAVEFRKCSKFELLLDFADIFQAKLAMKECFPDYSGDNSCEGASKFVPRKF